MERHHRRKPSHTLSSNREPPPGYEYRYNPDGSQRLERIELVGNTRRYTNTRPTIVSYHKIGGQ